MTHSWLTLDGSEPQPGRSPGGQGAGGRGHLSCPSWDFPRPPDRTGQRDGGTQRQLPGFFNGS